MKYGFDCTYAFTNETGIGSYVSNLVSALQQSDACQMISFFHAGQVLKSAQPNAFTRKVNSLYRDLHWTHFILPHLIKREKINLLHIPANVSPIYSTCPTVITIYDLLLFDHPKKMTSWQKIYFRSLLPLSAKHTQKIITISEYSKKSIIRSFHIPEKKIAVTYLAASLTFQRISDDKIKEVKSKYHLDNFILMVGSLEWHKNPQIVFEALSRLKKKGKKIQFVHAGPPGWHKEDVKSRIYQLGIEDQVSFLGYVPLEDLVALYNAANLFVFVSFYEGFGLPVLEAMACGCPVITSNTTSLPEVTGDAGIMIDPANADELVQAIERILSDPVFAEELSQRGLERSRLFSWEKCAQQTLQIYQEVLEGRS